MVYLVAIIVCGRHGIPCGRHGIPCGHHGLWPSWYTLWPSWSVAVMVCGRHGIRLTHQSPRVEPQRCAGVQCPGIQDQCPVQLIPSQCEAHLVLLTSEAVELRCEYLEV